MKLPLRVSLALAGVLVLAAPAILSARNTREVTRIGETRNEQRAGRNDRPLWAKTLFSTAAIDTFVLAHYTFEGPAGECDAQGWYGVDITAPIGPMSHVDDFAGLGGGTFGGLEPLEGLQSLWCGARADSADLVYCSWATLPGYGNHWIQGWQSEPLAVIGDVTLSYLIRWDTEPGYDFVWAEYMDSAGGWVELAEYDNGGEAAENWTIPYVNLPDSLRVRFRFWTDGAFSDEDGQWNTDGAFIVDSLLVADSAGVVNFQDFEAEEVGAAVTADGSWYAVAGPGYGDFAGLYPGVDVVQEDRCARNTSCLWGFFSGSAYDYSCGGHPEQPAVPFENDRGQYIHNEIWSPWIDWTHDQHGTPVPNLAGESFFEFDVYEDLPLDNVVFFVWHVRWRSGDCPSAWEEDNFLFHGPGYPRWATFMGRLQVGALVPSYATEVQLAIGVMDLCRFYCGLFGDGACHSHAPLIDNVRLTRVSTPGPLWVPRAWTTAVYTPELFQDNFPEPVDFMRPGTGEFTSAGRVRVDIGQDVLSSGFTGVHPGDSLTIIVLEPTVGLDNHVTGSPASGPAVYLHVKDLPGKSGAVVSGGPKWPYVPSMSGSGWTVVRMDSVLERSAPDDQYCVDVNDDLYTPGDTIFYYLSARDSIGRVTYWSRHTGTTIVEAEARMLPMEMTCLPANALSGATDILFVDADDGGGAQSYFDYDFEALGITPDRYDMVEHGSKNGLGSRVKDVAQQLIPYYRKIIWSSGDKIADIIGDGSFRNESDDFAVLHTFLEQHPNDCGIYFTGDNLAYDWTTLGGSSGASFRYTFMNHSAVNRDHVAAGEPLAPLAVGQPGSCFDGPAGPDTLITFGGGCPVPNEFDVLTPQSPATLEMAYSNDPGHGAVVAQQTINDSGMTAGVLLSGFGYGFIRDDRVQFPYDRIVHLQTILEWLGNVVDDPTGPGTGPLYRNELAQNYPNPFNPTTRIRYSIRERGHVSVRIYNVAGQLVRTLVDDVKPAGPRAVVWDGVSNGGVAVSSGVYFYKLASGSFTQTKKMVVMK